MKLLIIQVAYLLLIGLVCYFTQSAMPLWALLLIPNKLNEKNI